MHQETLGWVATVVLLLIIGRAFAQVLLESINIKHLRELKGRLPKTVADVLDESTFLRTGEYTLAKARLRQVNSVYLALVLAAVLFSGVLPWTLNVWTEALGFSPLSQAGYLFTMAVALSIPEIPVDWYSRFRVEQKFGFNTETLGLWWMDKLKSLALGLMLGLPLLYIIIWCMERAGENWWLWAWITFIGAQLLIAVLAPVLIMPLFNKFSPLPNGTLRDRLLELARRTRFRAANIQVMDGSKRSRHSNAFFTGFGRFRKIVLFDTLVQQLNEPELEAVLAHEIGHYKRHHLPKMLAFSAVGSLAAFYALSVLMQQPWFFRSFGLVPGNSAVALLLFSLLAGVFTFWLGPFWNAWSRKHEYEADAFASEVMKGSSELVSALRRLTEKNLSNLVPHPLYSTFYYSHPTLLERQAALEKRAPAESAAVGV